MKIRRTILLAFILCAMPRLALAQEGSPEAAVAGAALGAYSGAMLGTIGSIFPCTQTYVGATCIRWSSFVGGALGLSGGVLLGANHEGKLGDVAIGTGIGFLAGAAGGMAVKALAQRVGWEDVFAVGLIGGAVGSAPWGSLMGLAIGGSVGGILWPTVNGFTGVDAMTLALAGLAIGGVTQWVVDGIGASSNGTAQIILPVSVRF